MNEDDHAGKDIGFWASYRELMEGVEEEKNLLSVSACSPITITREGQSDSQSGAKSRLELDSPPSRIRTREHPPRQSPQHLRSSNLSSTQLSLSYQLSLSEEREERPSEDRREQTVVFDGANDAKRENEDHPVRDEISTALTADRRTCTGLEEEDEDGGIVGTRAGDAEEDDANIRAQPKARVAYGLEASEPQEPIDSDEEEKPLRQICSQTQLICSQTQVVMTQEESTKGGVPRLRSQVPPVINRHMDDDRPDENNSQDSNRVEPSLEVSPVKKTRLTVDSHSQNFADISAVESGTESSSIFSSRWGCQNASSCEGSRLNLSDTVLTADDDDCFDDALACSGWDAKWSMVGDPLLPPEGDMPTGEAEEALVLFSRVEQGLEEEKVDAGSIQTVLASFLKWKGLNGDLTPAPTCTRLRRRVLHRPSQETTQTVAAPVSVLDWIRRTRPKGLHSSVVFGTPVSMSVNVTSVANEMGNLCRRLNISSSGSNNDDLWTNGWMDTAERSVAYDCLQSLVSSFAENQEGEFKLEIVGGSNNPSFPLIDCLEVLCFVPDSRFSADLVQHVKAGGEHLQTFDLKAMGLPAYQRVAGPWRPSSAWRRLVILDMKVLPMSSSWTWAVSVFFEKSREQIKHIVTTAAHGRASQKALERIRTGEIGLGDFLRATQVLGRDIPITSYESLLAVLAAL